jgi:hypothetical protein
MGYSYVPILKSSFAFTHRAKCYNQGQVLEISIKVHKTKHLIGFLQFMDQLEALFTDRHCELQ